MAAQLVFPLQFVRQFKGPIDADMVFDTEASMNEYLSSARRYAGQIATCLEKEGFIYVMSADLSKWIQINADLIPFVEQIHIGAEPPKDLTQLWLDIDLEGEDPIATDHIKTQRSGQPVYTPNFNNHTEDFKLSPLGTVVYELPALESKTGATTHLNTIESKTGTITHFNAIYSLPQQTEVDYNLPKQPEVYYNLPKQSEVDYNLPKQPEVYYNLPKQPEVNYNLPKQSEVYYNLPDLKVKNKSHLPPISKVYYNLPK